MMGEDENAEADDDIDILGGCESGNGSQSNPPPENPLTKTPSHLWTIEEQQLFMVGLEQFGNSWSKISKLIGTKTVNQVRSHAKPYAKVKKTSTIEESAFDELRPLLQNRVYSDIAAEVVRLDKKDDLESGDLEVDVNETADHVTPSLSIESLQYDVPLDQNSECEDEYSSCTVVEPLCGDSENNSGESESKDGSVCGEWSNDDGVESDGKPLKADYIEITEEEKLANPDFFKGGPRKTPERYLKLRDKILFFWEQSRPERLSKGVLRSKLSHCGDVSAIGRIYDYLQSVGAINYGCNDDDSKASRSKTQIKIRQSSKRDLNPAIHMELRKRKSLSVRASDLGDSGCTLEHGADGQVVSKVAGREGRTRDGTLRPLRANPFQLVPCASYTVTQPAPFSVSVHLGAVLLMEIHAHCLQTEVIGLLGGSFHHRKRELHILSTAPCDSLSTDVECEMDPVSQAVASEWLRSQGQQVVGWYHSHPTFAPTPSIRDLETQAKFQELFQWQSQQPFVSVILSPFLPSENSRSAKATSKFQYWLLGDQASNQLEACGSDLHGNVGVPYCLRASLMQSEQKALSVEMLDRLRELYQKAQKHPNRTLLNRKWGDIVDIRYIDKLFLSLQCHIQKAGVSEENMGAMLSQIEKVFNDREWW